MRELELVIKKLKDAQKEKNRYVYFNLGISNKVLIFLEFLYSEGFISSYYIEEEKKVKVYIKYDFVGKGCITSFSLVKKGSGLMNRSFKELKSDSNKGIYYVVSTDAGLVYTKNYLSRLKGKGGLCLGVLN